jgi:hypothetical protein
VFVIKLLPLPRVSDPTRVLRALLKSALRKHGLQCTEISEAETQTEKNTL